MKDFLPQFLEFPEACIFGFFNESRKQVFLLFSKDPLQLLQREIKALQGGVHAVRELQDGFNNGEVKLHVVKTFEKTHPMPVLKAEFSRVLSHLMLNGYVNLRPDIKAVKYRLKIKLMEHYDDTRRRPLVYVLAISKRNDKLLMGLFENLRSAEVWVRDNINNSQDLVPRFCDNELTKAYHSKYGLKFVH